MFLKNNKQMCEKVKGFVIRHEWLGKMPHRPTHRFIATYKGKLAGVIVMATPNAFSHLLGKEHQDKEKLKGYGLDGNLKSKQYIIEYFLNL